MFTITTHRTSFAALALSVLVTVATLGGIRSLAAQPAADSLFASRSVPTHVVSAPSVQQAKG